MSRASSTSASVTPLAPHSTIRIASLEPETIRSISSSSSVSSSGLTTKSPSSLPIRTAPTCVGDRDRRDRERRGGAVHRQDVVGVDVVHRHRLGRRAGSRSASPSGTAGGSAGRSSARSGSPSRRPAPRGGRTSRGSCRRRSASPRRRPSAAGSRRRAGCPSSPCRGPSCRPQRTTTAPPAWRASLPVSKEISLPPTSTETRLTSNMLMYSLFLSAARLAANLAQNSRSLTRRDVSRCRDSREVRPRERRRPQRAIAGRDERRRRPGDAARIPLSKSRRTRAATGSERRSRSKRSRSRPSARARSHRCGSSTRALVGVDRVHHLPEARPRAEPRPPRRRRAGPALAGAWWPPGSGASTRRSGSSRDPRPGGGAVRAGEVQVDDRLGPVAADVVVGPDGGTAALVSSRTGARRSPRLRRTRRRASEATRRRPRRRLDRDARASKIRFAPGISSGVGDSCTQRTIPSSSTSTSERLACPTRSSRRRSRG